jgi:hypothetical protein
MSALPTAPVSALVRIRAISKWRKAARVELPHARLEPGSGPWISVAECSPQTVHFHQTEQAAQKAVRWLDDTGCGGKGCAGARQPGLVAQHWMMPLV